MASAAGSSLKEVGQLQERYRILAKLGSGGMADVFLGVQLGEQSFQRLVVIKRVHSLWLENQNAMKMFIAEARTIAQLNHPHIVQIYDLSRLSKDICITMEYINGENLDYVRKAVLRAKKTIPLPIVCKMMVEAAEALNYAHATPGPDGQPMNLVHRDVGPHNLMLNTSGYLKVIDFGIAKSSARSDLTTPGMIKGKFSYLAPDLFKFDEIDGRIDLYALGLVFYELVTLKRCFEFKRDVTVAEVLKRVTTEEVAPPSKLVPQADKKLDALIGRAIDKDREARFQTGEEFAAEIRAFSDKHGGLASSSDVENWFGSQFKERLDKRREFEKKALEKAKRLAEQGGEEEPQAGLSTTGSIQTSNISGITGVSQFAMQSQTPSQIAPVKKANPYLLIVVFFLLFAGAAVLVHQLFFRAPGGGVGEPGEGAKAENLLIKSDVPGAAVRVDGQDVGLTSPDGLRVRIEPERMHLIEVAKAGYEPFAIELEGAEGVVQTLQAPLTRLERKADGGLEEGGPDDRLASAAPASHRGPKEGAAPIRGSGHGPGPAHRAGPGRRPHAGAKPKGHAGGRGGGARTKPDEPAPGPAKPDAASDQPAPGSGQAGPKTPKDETAAKPKPGPAPAKPVEVPKIYIPPVPDPAVVAAIGGDEGGGAGKTEKKNYLSKSGNWTGSQVASRGCGSCHNGSKAPALDWNSRSKRLWKKFFQRHWHKKNGKLEDMFSKAELKRVRAFILSHITEENTSGIAGVK